MNTNGAKLAIKESDNDARATDTKTLADNGTKTESSGEDTKTDSKLAAVTYTAT